MSCDPMGVKWFDDVPQEKYTVEVLQGCSTSGVELLSDAADSSRLTSLLQWLSQYVRFGVAGNDVIWNEQLSFLVKSKEISHTPEWSATIRAFDIWEQQDIAVIYKLSVN
eukprot:Skav204843  [mRNA]  locus=C8798836:33:474:- [translate_table: standard]